MNATPAHIKIVHPSEGFIWGLDLGVGSLGWSVIRPANSNGVGELVDCGVRIFPATVDSGDLARGNEVAPGKARRLAASMRRLRERRRIRLVKLTQLLQQHGLLPAGDVTTSEGRDRYWKVIDAQLGRTPRGDTTAAHTWLYRLFARGLSENLEPYQIGRVLYHAAHRRGFKTNRNEATREKEKIGAVKKGIAATRALRAAGEPHLVTAFARLDPEAPEQRIRGRYTLRADREVDVLALLLRQTAAHPLLLSSTLAEEIAAVIFDQLSAKQNTSLLVGRCALLGVEPLNERRAPVALPSLQRLRVLQKVNDLEIIAPDGSARVLAAAERLRVRDRLLNNGDLPFTELRALLELPPKPRKRKGADAPEPGYDFNLAAGGETKLAGDRTHPHLFAALGDKWLKLDPAQRDALVDLLLSEEDDGATTQALFSQFGLTAEQAQRAIEAVEQLESARGQFCAEAARALCARLDTQGEQHVRLATALKAEREIRGLRPPTETRVFDRLPPLVSSRPDEDAFFTDPTHLRNPVIMRALAELRLIVNALLRKYGKPAKIRLELIRDLKKPRSVREEISKVQRERATLRDDVRGRLKTETGIAQPSNDDIEKWLLAAECGWLCPYTGRTITPLLLFGTSVEFQVEHIIPRSRSLDNSFANKTLCQVDENSQKHNKTPVEAYSSDEQRWHEILPRVRCFHGPGAAGKLRRFQWTAEDLIRVYGNDFTRRHLQDTAWAARLAAEYLGTLFGGVNDPTGTRRVETVSGSVTGVLRQAWGLSTVLLERPDLPKLPPPAADRPKHGAPDKLRADHRHHAVDAVVIALTEPGAIASLNRAFEQSQVPRNLELPRPWPKLGDQLAACLDRLTVSHRVDRRTNGALHEATHYGRRKDGVVVLRCRLDALAPADFERIRGGRIRAAVLRAWAARPTDVTEPAKFFKSRENLPQLTIPNRCNGTTREVVIHSVTLAVRVTPVAIGERATRREVKTGDNFCVGVVEKPSRGKKGKPSLEFRPVTRLDALKRIRQRKPGSPPLRADQLVPLADGERVRFTVRSSETLRLHGGKHVGLLHVNGASDGELECTRLNDARGAPARKALKDRIRLAPSSFLAARAEKVALGPLGEVTVAHD